MKVWLLLNLLAYAGAAWWDGWHGVGALLLLQVIGSVILAAVFVYCFAGREDPSRRRIRERLEALEWEHHVREIEGLPDSTRPWRDPR